MREIVIYRGHGGPGQADFFRATLEEAGIGCLVRSATSVASHPFTVGPMGEFEILVAADDSARAQQVIETLTVESSGRIEPGDGEGHPRGLLSRAKRPTTDKDRRLFFVTAIAALLGGIALWLGDIPSGQALGITLAIVSLMFFVASRKP